MQPEKDTNFVVDPYGPSIAGPVSSDIVDEHSVNSESVVEQLVENAGATLQGTVLKPTGITFTDHCEF